MPITRRIYVSLPADPWLSEDMNELKWGIVEEIEKLGYTPEIFTNPNGKPGLASPKAWNPRDADEIARRCVGAAILGMPRWNFQDAHGEPALLPTEFNHYEGAPWLEPWASLRIGAKVLDWQTERPYLEVRR